MNIPNLPYFVAGLITALVTGFILIPLVIRLAQILGVFDTVREGTANVYVLFGKVLAVIERPGFVFLPAATGWRFLFVRWLGRRHVLDLRLDQVYLRSQPVNSEEGAPMGIGVWYEMVVSDPVAFLFRNADPRGSLAANVSNAVVQKLSNLPLGLLLTDRHAMSQVVRAEVSPTSDAWGYQVGSVYIRKVHFRDDGMTKQIETKVVNRLRQVTAAINQAGANEVSVITSTAARQAAVEFAKAQAARPRIVGAALAEIAKDADVSAALFDVLEMEKLIASTGELILVPEGQGLINDLVAAK